MEKEKNDHSGEFFKDSLQTEDSAPEEKSTFRMTVNGREVSLPELLAEYREFRSAVKAVLGGLMTEKAENVLDDVLAFLSAADGALKDCVWHSMDDTPEDGTRCILFSEYKDIITEAYYRSSEKCIATYDGPGFYVSAADPFGNLIYAKYNEDDRLWWMPFREPGEERTE